jgi:tyrosyl-DNA phosphodiesterase-1
MTDIPWLVQQYPPVFRTKPLLIVHGEKRQEKAAIDLEASRFSHIKLYQAKLEIMYGTHHT